MLTENIKANIRQAHQLIGKNLPHYQVRKQQNYLVAEIAKTLAGEYDKSRRICVIEAGTGTGKSLAYCLGTLILAKAQKKKVVISTATVALQEQLFNKDLPFFAKHSDLDLSFDLVKGRQRYACATKLAQFDLNYAAESEFQQLFLSPPTEHDKTLLADLANRYRDKKWDGDRDSWPTTIPDQIWQHVVSDKHSCTRSLAEHRHCPFSRARDNIETLDVLIVNHSLLLADLELGGGIIISAPADSIYIIDEGHHLPKVTRDFSAAQATVKGAKDWLEKMPKLVNKLQVQLTSSKSIGVQLKIDDANLEVVDSLDKVYQWLQVNHGQLFSQDSGQLRFENGELPDFLLLHAELISPASRKMLAGLQKMQELLKQQILDDELSPSLAEPLLTELGFFLNRSENLNKLWDQLAYVKRDKAPPNARWIEVLQSKGNIDYLIATSPLEVGFILADKLWSQCAGAVICSATLTALNKFDFFCHQAGLEKNDGTQYLNVLSPFNYQENAILWLPKVNCEPNDPQFDNELIRILPSLLDQQLSSLVLFSSYRQMTTVAEALRQQHGLTLLLQGEFSRQLLINKHLKKIDKGESSIIFGTQSFSEGLDLPGNYLNNLIITKLPFAVPTSPVEEAHAEYIKLRGGNAFMELTIPEASKKLVQACGRLIRKENDTGRVIILDRRLLSKRYGKAMLDALPPFQRKIDY